MDSENISISDCKELKNNESEDIFENIKSYYLLKKIGNNIKKNRLMKIIKYSKKIQKRFKLGIKDYKEYLELFAPIEIEMIPIKNKFGKFMNFLNEESKKYYHIYLNEDKEEINRNVLKEGDNAEKIKIIIDYQIKSFENLFGDCKCVKSIKFIKFYRTDINNMNQMFYYSSIKELDLTNLKTNNVTNMSYMFCGSSIEELNIFNFNTSNVTTMKGMFLWCTSLKKLNISNFKNNKVVDMSDMFADCESLEMLDLSDFNTANVTTMKGMFYGCDILQKLNVSNFNTNNVSDMGGMFCRCFSLKELDISNFNFDNVTNIKYMFSCCPEELIKKIRPLFKNYRNKNYL